MKAADGRTWTIGLRGFGPIPIPRLRTGDQVRFDLHWTGTLPVVGYGPPQGELQLYDASGRPLLWAGTTNIGFMTSWMWLGQGDVACRFPADSCDITRFNVAGMIEGQSVRMPPFGTANSGDYFVAAGQPVRPVVDDTRCPNYAGRSFDAAIIRVVPTLSSP